MQILITGAKGFMGKNLAAALKPRPDVTVLEYDQDNRPQDLTAMLAEADWVFHLAGVNRPQDEAEFQTGNVDSTTLVCAELLRLGRSTPIVLASSIQALLDNPYGVSKLKAEEVIRQYAERSGAPGIIYRLRNVFGKWCRPNYNSVVATFCYNVAHDLPLAISDPEKSLELIYIDDVVTHFVRDLTVSSGVGAVYREVTPVYQVTLGRLANLIQSFRQMRQTLLVPDQSNELTHKLYGTYLTYLEPGDFAYALDKKCDPRGCLAEFVKAVPFGQLFVSRTLPGITRGNHYHHTKTEKFLVIEGEAVIRFRHLLGGEIIEYRVRGEELRVVDIPPGYTHSIENVGQGELITLFWASEIFDPARPDTQALPVLV